MLWSPDARLSSALSWEAGRSNTRRFATSAEASLKRQLRLAFKPPEKTLNSFLGVEGRQSLEAAVLNRAEQAWRATAESASGPAQLARRWAELLTRADLADYLVEALKAGADRHQWPSPLVGAVATELGELDLSFPPPLECATQLWGPYTYGVAELLETFAGRCREMRNHTSSFNAVSATLSATISALQPCSPASRARGRPWSPGRPPRRCSEA